MSTVQLRNVNPLGAVDLPLIGRQDGTGEHAGAEGVGALEPGEVFEVDAKVAGKAPTYDDEGAVTDLGEGLLAQVGNYELVKSAASKSTAKQKG